METVKRIVGSVEQTYLVRSYIIGGIFFALLLWFTSSFVTSGAWVGITWGLIATALYPFAKLSWDELRDFALGKTMLILPIVILYPAKIIINGLLWFFALFIAPLGILYLAYRTRQQ